MADTDRKPNLKLRRARTRRKLSQARLAEMINEEILRTTGDRPAITFKSVSDWERGWYTWPSADVRVALCKILGAADPAELGFYNGRATRSAADGAASGLVRSQHLLELVHSKLEPAENLVLGLSVPDGRVFSGVDLTAVVVPRKGSMDPKPSPEALGRLSRTDRRTALVTHSPSGVLHIVDGREYVTQFVRPSDPPPIPDAYRLDDFTIGIIWAVTNTDAAILADDGALDTYRRSLARYEAATSSSAALGEVPRLNDLSRLWLGSSFCSRHILRHSTGLGDEPLFWTRERCGEEAASWLLWRHKLEYLRETFRRHAGMRRAFCIPEHAVRSSPRYERVLFLLAVALMEACGIEVQVSAEPQLAEVEGFVIADDVIVANWLRGAGLWYVDNGAPASRRAIYREISGLVAAESVIAHPSAVGRLQAMAAYLDLPWGWFAARCRELAVVGVERLAHPRSRLLSTTGVCTALRYVAYLDQPTILEGASSGSR